MSRKSKGHKAAANPTWSLFFGGQNRSKLLYRSRTSLALPVLIGKDGTFVDAAWEVENMLRVDPANGDAPAFRNPRTGRCFTVPELNEEVKRLMRLIGEDPSEYGSHSLRIGGATAMFKAGRGELDIRTAGRWERDLLLSS